MYTTLTSIYLQHYLHYVPYKSAATVAFPQDNLIILRCSQFINVRRRGMELLLTPSTVQLLLLVIQG